MVNNQFIGRCGGVYFQFQNDSVPRIFGVKELFRVHHWKEDLETLGRVSADFIHTVSEGALSFDWPAQVDRLTAHGGHDLILSIGQVVPHEVVGMAGHMKNIFIGAGGAEAINKSHYLGAVYGMERMMGALIPPCAPSWTTPPRASPRTCRSCTSSPSSAGSPTAASR